MYLAFLFLFPNFFVVFTSPQTHPCLEGVPLGVPTAFEVGPDDSNWQCECDDLEVNLKYIYIRVLAYLLIRQSPHYVTLLQEIPHGLGHLREAELCDLGSLVGLLEGDSEAWDYATPNIQSSYKVIKTVKVYSLKSWTKFCFHNTKAGKLT